MDDSRTQGVSILATMWGELADFEFTPGTIIAVSGARISTYLGKSLNIDEDAKITPEPRALMRYEELVRAAHKLNSAESLSLEPHKLSLNDLQLCLEL
jgi:hypothetical protein